MKNADEDTTGDISRKWEDNIKTYIKEAVCAKMDGNEFVHNRA
jgi:hypothetical protein